MFPSSDPRRRRFALFAVLVVAACLLFGEVLGGHLSRHYRVLFELQDVKCLPFTVAIVKLGRPDSLKRGDYVAMIPHGRLGDRVDAMMAVNPGRRFIVKEVGGLPGDVLKVERDRAFVNEQFRGDLDLLERLGKATGAFDRHEVVAQGHYLLFGTLPRSYDSRYWGQAPIEELFGVVYPIF